MSKSVKEEKAIQYNDIAIHVKDLKKYFEDVKAIDGINFKIKKGECFGFLGPNGAGKTTTINIISCYMNPTSGTAIVNGFDIKKETSDVKRVIGIAPQENIFYEELTVYENVIFFGKMYPIEDTLLRARAEDLIKKVGLQDKRDTRSEKLSGGMKRRLNLIIGLVHDPNILFLDEPTAGLDPQSRRMLWDYLFELKERNKTIFLTTHYMDEADVLSDRLAIIDHGKIIAQGTPEHLKETIGKGDLLSFKIEGPKSKILKAIEDLRNKIDIIDAEYLKEELIVRITAMDGLGKIGKITNHFMGDDLQVADATVQRNSLENVFLALTGRSLRE